MNVEKDPSARGSTAQGSTAQGSTAHESTAQGSTETPEVSRRLRKKLQTRESIRASALRLFVEYGFEATTITHITEAADVAPRTFFLHFAGKDDVLLGDSRAGFDTFLAALATRPADEDALTSIREVMLSEPARDVSSLEEVTLQARLLTEAPHLVGRVFEQYAGFEGALRSAIAERYALDAETDAYPAMLAACVLSAARVGLTVWYARGAVEPLNAVTAEMFDVLAAGLSRPVT